MHVTTTTARSKMFRLELELDEAPQDFRLEISVGGMTPDDLTECALRTVLFGEPNPLADQHMGFAVEIDDPLDAAAGKPGFGGDHSADFGVAGH